MNLSAFTFQGYIDPDLKPAYDNYVDHQMRGCTPEEAALRVFVPHEHLAKWVRTAESDPYVIQRKAAAMKAFNAKAVWTPETAVIHLLRMVENPYEKGSVRLNAVKELNVLLGITTVDEQGRTRRSGMSLADFYKLEASDASAAKKPH